VAVPFVRHHPGGHGSYSFVLPGLASGTRLLCDLTPKKR
jgi:hypothetical protein